MVSTRYEWPTPAGREEPTEIELVIILVERNLVNETVTGIASQFIGADGFWTAVASLTLSVELFVYGMWSEIAVMMYPVQN